MYMSHSYMKYTIKLFFNYLFHDLFIRYMSNYINIPNHYPLVRNPLCVGVICQNGGSCASLNDTHYQCKCTLGHGGEHCECELNRVLPSHCSITSIAVHVSA